MFDGRRFAFGNKRLSIFSVIVVVDKHRLVRQNFVGGKPGVAEVLPFTLGTDWDVAV
jgi:hypothetical protein